MVDMMVPSLYALPIPVLGVLASFSFQMSPLRDLSPAEDSRLTLGHFPSWGCPSSKDQYANGVKKTQHPYPSVIQL